MHPVFEVRNEMSPLTPTLPMMTNDSKNTINRHIAVNKSLTLALLCLYIFDVCLLSFSYKEEVIGMML